MFYHYSNSINTSTSINPSISTLSTFTINNSELLDNFKTAFQLDTEWRDAIAKFNPSFTFQDNLVFHDKQLFIPQSLWSQILYSCHDAVLASHPGWASTYDLVKCDYSWPGLWRYIRSYVSFCQQCMKIKNITHKPYGLLQPLDIPDKPWRSIAMDFIIILPPSDVDFKIQMITKVGKEGCVLSGSIKWMLNTNSARVG